MRPSIRLAVVLLLALVVVGSAGAGGKPRKLVRVVKRQGSITATLTYARGPNGLLAVSRPTLSVREHGRLVLRRLICPPQLGDRRDCAWGTGPALALRRVTAGRQPSAVLNLYTGGNTCCTVTLVGLLGHRPHWTEHRFTTYAANGRRIHGRYDFSSADGRFYCTFTACAGSTDPIQVWTISRAGRFQDATRTVPGLVRVDARRLTRSLRPSHHQTPEGTLAAWCADQYLLNRGLRCTDRLHYDLAHGYLRGSEGNERGRPFVRDLNRDLHRWGYKR